MSLKVVIGIISYLPDDLKVREKRLSAHVKQLKGFNELFPNVDVLDVCQQYNPSEVELCEAVANNGTRSYTAQQYGKLGACGARNVILKQFYNSDLDFCMITDDDTLLFPYYDVERFFDDLCHYESKSDIGLIRPLIPTMTPFKKQNYQERTTVRSHWILRSSMGIAPFGVFILSNLKKYFGQEVYFDESINPNNCDGYDDYDFVLSLREKRIPSHTCKQLVVRPLVLDTSVAFNGEDLRRKNHAANICATYDRHPSLGVNYKVVDGKVKSDVSKLNVWNPVYVPRSVPYDIPENLKPKSVDDSDVQVKRRNLLCK